MDSYQYDNKCDKIFFANVYMKYMLFIVKNNLAFDVNVFNCVYLSEYSIYHLENQIREKELELEKLIS